MRREVRWAIVAIAALAAGAICAAPYARLAAPYYEAVDRLIAANYPWEIASVDVKAGKTGPSSELRLVGYVRRHRDDPQPAAMIVGHVQVGEAVETPVVFWTLLLIWPAASLRQRVTRLAIGLPVFLVLEAATTACQLIYSMAGISAELAGADDPLTMWDRWSRFLETGGRFAIELGAALLTVSLGSRLPLTSGSPRTP